MSSNSTSVSHPYILVMAGHYDRDPGQDNFLLVLIHASKGLLNQWLCTSSHASGQQRGDQHVRGGLIPPVHHVPGLSKWEVDLDPIYMPHHKGVRGNFYKILPFKVKTSKGAIRGDFGIHLDANAPGSLGCCVMNRFNWEDFERTIAKLKAETNISKIPFFPLYS